MTPQMVNPTELSLMDRPNCLESSPQGRPSWQHARCVVAARGGPADGIVLGPSTMRTRRSSVRRRVERGATTDPTRSHPSIRIRLKEQLHG